jgi:hypothetical protein
MVVPVTSMRIVIMVVMMIRHFLHKLVFVVTMMVGVMVSL